MNSYKVIFTAIEKSGPLRIPAKASICRIIMADSYIEAQIKAMEMSGQINGCTGGGVTVVSDISRVYG